MWWYGCDSTLCREYRLGPIDFFWPSCWRSIKSKRKHPFQGLLFHSTDLRVYLYAGITLTLSLCLCSKLNFRIVNQPTLLFFNIILATLGLWHFQVTLRIFLSIFCSIKPIRILKEVIWNLCHFGDFYCFTNDMPSDPWTWVFFTIILIFNYCQQYFILFSV